MPLINVSLLKPLAYLAVKVIILYCKQNVVEMCQLKTLYANEMYANVMYANELD